MGLEIRCKPCLSRHCGAMLYAICCIADSVYSTVKPLCFLQACRLTALTRQKPSLQAQMGRRTAQQMGARKAVQRAKQRGRRQRRPRSPSPPAIAWTTLLGWCLHKRSWSNFQKAAATCPSDLAVLLASCCSRTALQVHQSTEREEAHT